MSSLLLVNACYFQFYLKPKQYREYIESIAKKEKSSNEQTEDDKKEISKKQDKNIKIKRFAEMIDRFIQLQFIFICTGLELIIRYCNPLQVVLQNDIERMNLTSLPHVCFTYNMAVTEETAGVARDTNSASIHKGPCSKQKYVAAFKTLLL